MKFGKGFGLPSHLPLVTSHLSVGIPEAPCLPLPQVLRSVAYEWVIPS